MKVLASVLFGLAVMALPAMAQTPAPTSQELQQQADQTIQNQNNALSNAMNQQQLGQLQDQQRRDQLFNSAPVYSQPLPPVYVPPPPPPPPAR